MALVHCCVSFKYERKSNQTIEVRRTYLFGQIKKVECEEVKAIAGDALHVTDSVRRQQLCFLFPSGFDYRRGMLRLRRRGQNEVLVSKAKTPDRP